MPRVTVEPGAIEFDAEPGETVMGAARRAGYAWPTLCEMAGQCTVCHLVVTSDPAAVSAKNGAESDATALIRHRYSGVDPDNLRLACQARVLDDVAVLKKGVKPAAS